MIYDIIKFIPEILLLIGVLNIGCLHLLSYDKARSYIVVSRFWILMSVLASVLLHDIIIKSLYFENNAYILLFRLISSGFIYIILGLSAFWFSTQKQAGVKYYILILLSLIGLNLIISSTHILCTYACYIYLVILNFYLLSIDNDNKQKTSSLRYLMLSIFMIFVFGIGCYLLYNFIDGSLNYKHISLILSEKFSTTLYIAFVMIIIPLLYSLCIVPFHFNAEEKVCKSILPVSHYFAIVYPLCIWGVFIKLNLNVLIIYAQYFSNPYLVCGILSVFFGAIGANSRINLHRIFSYSSMYHYGVIMILLSLFEIKSEYNAFFYMFLYYLSLNGVYMVFYSLKSRGEYLSTTISLSGLSKTKPYATGALLISIFSLIGLPPLVGFLAQMNFIFEMINTKSYFILGFVLFCLVMLVNSYLEIIKSAYFDSKLRNYDMQDKRVIFYIVISLLCIIIATFNPNYIFEVLQEMFYVILL